MAILLTAGLGKTGQRIAHLCQEASVPFLVTLCRGQSAAPAGMPATRFYWNDSAFQNPFLYRFPNGELINAVYLVAGDGPDLDPQMNAFPAAQQNQAKDTWGEWSHFLETGVEYYVLRRAWFMENFSNGAHQRTIKTENKIFTACGDGKTPFVSAFDIAHVPFRALPESNPHNCEYVLLGPELLTFDGIAMKLTKQPGSKIEHVKLNDEECKQQFIGAGLPRFCADLLVKLEIETRNGSGNWINDAVEQVTGTRPVNFDTFVEENKGCWQGVS